jgi:hypothetical protein
MNALEISLFVRWNRVLVLSIFGQRFSQRDQAPMIGEAEIERTVSKMGDRGGRT